MRQTLYQMLFTLDPKEQQDENLNSCVDIYEDANGNPWREIIKDVYDFKTKPTVSDLFVYEGKNVEIILREEKLLRYAVQFLKTLFEVKPRAVSVSLEESEKAGSKMLSIAVLDKEQHVFFDQFHIFNQGGGLVSIR